MADEWVGKIPDTTSPYYPYEKVVESNTLAGADAMTYKLMRYLMDLPSPGYTPPSDNKYPRARLKKLLYWDCERPLDMPLPTTDQMFSIMFDPANPAAPSDAERGYRLFSQEFVQQAQHKGQTILRVNASNSNTIERKELQVIRQQFIFTVLVNVNLESNVGTENSSRSFDIMQAIIEATAGVNFGGVGSMQLQYVMQVDDEHSNTGFKIYQYIDWTGSAPNPAYV